MFQERMFRGMFFKFAGISLKKEFKDKVGLVKG